MKTLSVMFTLVLLVAANKLAAQMKRANALPMNSTQNARAVSPAGATTTFVSFQNVEH
jgi:hypothetical protein